MDVMGWDGMGWDGMGWRTVRMTMRYGRTNEDAELTALSMIGAIPETGKVLPFAGTVAEEA
jgi:hypothetical protein